MDRPITEEESYADRRQLFKNIWDTSINIEKKYEEKEKSIVHKPKVIKTARLDEVDRCIVGKKKQQRIKNLRIFCNKLLDLCDRQDADDMFYEQMEGRQSPTQGRKKSKIRKFTRVKKATCIFTPIQDAPQTECLPDKFIKQNKSSRNTSPKGMSFNVQENYRKKRNKLQNFPGAKMLISASRKNSNKRLFPINKIYID